MWRDTLALVALKVIDIKTIDLADSPNKYFREIMAALLMNSKAEPESGTTNLSRYIYQKVLTDKIAEVHLAGKDIPYELSRIEMKGEYYDFYAHFFFGDRYLEISDDATLLAKQTKENKFISQGMKLFENPGMEEQKIAHLKQLFQAISKEKIFEKEEERFLAFKFIKWAHGKESNAIVRKEIEYKIAGLALDSFLLLPNTHSNLKTSAEVASSLREAMKSNPYKITASSNEKFVYPDWLSAGISPIGKDYTQNNIIKQQITNIAAIPSRPYQKSFWIDSTLMARGLSDSFEKNYHNALLRPSYKYILLNTKKWESFESTFEKVAKNQELKNFLLQYDYAKPEDKLEMIKYALLRSRSINTQITTGNKYNPFKGVKNFLKKNALEEQKMLWLQLVAVKVKNFERGSDLNGFTKLIIELAPQIDSMKIEAKNSIDLKASIDRVEYFLKPISSELASKLNILKT
ncbi:hypothetical protein BY996DRAFT_8393109 [Phakopsora pachyrhizi]|nr:hypothetical protein BY996DRAFT_8393109 [Phakopsora pachyrhizi]